MDSATRNYHLMIGQPCRVAFNRQPSNRVHRHTFFEPCLVTSGRGRFDYGGAHHDLRPGDLFLAEPGIDHEISSHETRNLRLFFISFLIVESKGGGLTGREQDIIGHFMAHRVVHRPGQENLAKGFRYLFDSMRDQKNSLPEFLFQQHLRALILQIMLLLTELATQRPKQRFQDERVAKATRVIDAGIQHPLSVKSVARHSGVSERNLRRLFRTHLGRTVTQEIQQRKVQRAAALLALPELSVADVAWEIGIRDPGQFSRLFQKWMKEKPHTFRSAQRLNPWRVASSNDKRRAVFETHFQEQEGSTRSGWTASRSARPGWS